MWNYVDSCLGPEPLADVFTDQQVQPVHLKDFESEGSCGHKSPILHGEQQTETDPGHEEERLAHGEKLLHPTTLLSKLCNWW